MLSFSLFISVFFLFFLKLWFDNAFYRRFGIQTQSLLFFWPIQIHGCLSNITTDIVLTPRGARKFPMTVLAVSIRSSWLIDHWLIQDTSHFLHLQDQSEYPVTMGCYLNKSPPTFETTMGARDYLATHGSWPLFFTEDTPSKSINNLKMKALHMQSTHWLIQTPNGLCWRKKKQYNFIFMVHEAAEHSVGKLPTAHQSKIL